MHRHLPQPLSYHRKHTAIAKDIRIYSPPGAFGRDWHVHEVPRVAGAAQFDHNREPGEAEESGHRPHRERLRYEQGPQLETGVRKQPLDVAAPHVWRVGQTLRRRCHLAAAVAAADAQYAAEYKLRMDYA